MRLPESDDKRAYETIAAAAEAGITVFDTARAYGTTNGCSPHALRRAKADATARIVTKGGMSRAGWIPDGRAKAIRADCEASLAALDGLAIDLYLIHVPDPRTPWRTSVRALARLADEGLVRHVGLSNVNRTQLDEALELAPITAVQVALSPYDDHALRGGVVDRCAEKGIAVIAHSPLGGPRRAGRLARREELAEIADARGATPWEVALAWLLQLSPAVVAIPGARRPETARSAANAASLDLQDDDRAALARAFGEARPAPRKRRRTADGAEIVLVMGIPGAGKSRVAGEYVDHGYLRLNRDERGGTLRELAGALDEELSSGTRRLVLDNTYLTRAARSYVLDVANRHGSRLGASGSTHRSPRHRSTSSSGYSSASAASFSRGAAGSGAARARRARPDVPDADRPRAGAADGGRRIRERGAGAVHTVGRAWAAGGLRRGSSAQAARLERRSRAGRPERASPGLRLEPRRHRRGARRCHVAPRGRDLGAGGERAVPASGRPTDLLVPPAASRPAARLRKEARCRPLAIGPPGNLARTSDARDHSRRPLRSGLGDRLVQLDQSVDVRLHRELEARARDVAPNLDDVNRRQLPPEVVERREAHAEGTLADET